jgi:hypothetical protein
MRKPKYKTYEVYYDGKLIETIDSASKKSVREWYTIDNDNLTSFGQPKKWIMKLLEIKVAADGKAT